MPLSRGVTVTSPPPLSASWFAFSPNTLDGWATPSLVNGWVAVSGYRCSSGPGGSALWYCTISCGHCSVRSASSKNCDLASVAFPHTSCLGSTPPASFARFVLWSSYSQTLFMGHHPATPSCGSLFPSDRLVPTAIVGYIVVWSGCRGFRPTAFAPDRACISTGPVPVDLPFLLPSCHT